MVCNGTGELTSSIFHSRVLVVASTLVAGPVAEKDRSFARRAPFFFVVNCFLSGLSLMVRLHFLYSTLTVSDCELLS